MPPESSRPTAAEGEVLAVAQLNRLVRSRLEQGFPLVWVAGEVSNLTFAGSGHLYFALKDESAQVRCVMFRSRAQLLPFRLANGDRVQVRALPTLYEARGDFQLTVEAVRQAGVGALYEAYARLRARLLAEELFAAERKRALPPYPARIGVLTSPNAAALHDVLAALRRRAPHLAVIVYPVPVQGAGAAERIAAMLDLAGARAECDVLILARGGGSLEDLWQFNEEVLARAIVRCALPLVSGIGHEVDTTIADLAADLRAATPTAAAEVVSAGWVQARSRLADLDRGLHRAAERGLGERGQRLDALARRLIHPGERLSRSRLRLENLAARLGAAQLRRRTLLGHLLGELELRLRACRPELPRLRRELGRIEAGLQAACAQAFARRREHLAAQALHLEHLSPQATLRRGYAIALDARGEVVRDAARLAPGDALRLQLARGSADARVERCEPEQESESPSRNVSRNVSRIARSSQAD